MLHSQNAIPVKELKNVVGKLLDGLAALHPDATHIKIVDGEVVEWNPKTYGPMLRTPEAPQVLLAALPQPVAPPSEAVNAPVTPEQPLSVVKPDERAPDTPAETVADTTPAPAAIETPEAP